MIYAGADARRFALLRVVIFGIWLVDVSLDPFPALANLPPEWFTSVGPWLLIPNGLVAALWSPPVLLALKWLTLGCVGLAMVGARGHRIWAALACGLLLVLMAFVRGFGHVDHSQIQLLFVTFALLFLPAWDSLTIARPRATAVPTDPKYAHSFVALSVIFSLPYFFTAIYRIAYEGGSIFLGHTMRHFVARDSMMLDHLDFTLGLQILEYPMLDPLLNAGFAVVTVAEFLAPWVFLRRRWSVAWLLLILPFHLMSPLLMHVLFAHNIALLVVLYVWPVTWALRTSTEADLGKPIQHSS